MELDKSPEQVKGWIKEVLANGEMGIEELESAFLESGTRTNMDFAELVGESVSDGDLTYRTAEDREIFSLVKK